ncbi:hypothetical protein [Paludisphaera rhizosphaerae]|uniref:hypothetical protein n=1 Tax=Paludisphaera rhizosphaerae TaxID=2711216 RepID=UPI0013EB7886|nr:hypothetical protein [Paludisphaera rhizosphaerae]
MSTDEIETILANWIEQALSSSGSLPEGVSPASWVAGQFADWWRGRAGEAMNDAEIAVSAALKELTRLSGWDSFGEAMHEMAHVRDALGELRGLMRLPNESDV